MTDTVTIPRHLLELRDSWHAFAAQLGPRIAPVMAHTFTLPAYGEVDELSRWSESHLAKFEPWVNRLTAWVNGPLAKAVSDATISDEAMRRTCGRLGEFADELISWRNALNLQARSPAIRGAAPFLDAALVSLLEQMRDFARRVADALGPTALSAPEARRDGSVIELNFAFAPDINVPMANLGAWLKHARESLQAASMREDFDDLDFLNECTMRPASPSLFGAMMKLLGYVFLLVLVLIVLRSCVA